MNKNNQKRRKINKNTTKMSKIQKEPIKTTKISEISQCPFHSVRSISWYQKDESVGNISESKTKWRQNYSNSAGKIQHFYIVFLQFSREIYTLVKYFIVND